jgi:hypothetical protein
MTSPVPSTPTATPGRLARIICWRALPGQLQAYTDYLHAQVEPIDEAAVQAGVLRSHATWVDERPDAPWSHMRVFVFDTAEQRAAMKAKLAQLVEQRTPDPQIRATRAALAAQLRTLVSEHDVSLLG